MSNGDSGTQDTAGIAALAEFVAARCDGRDGELTVPVSALIDGDGFRRGGEGDVPPGPGHPRPRILLVEDNPVNRLLLGVLLDRLGLDHVAVGCGEEAILRMVREAFDAVLLDVAMDGMAGLATARAICRLAGDDRPPLIALGRAGLDEDVLEAAGFDAVADAPLDTRRLAGALIAALEKDLAESIGG